MEAAHYWYGDTWVDPPTPGSTTLWQGGYYAGIVLDGQQGNKQYHLVRAPRVSGGLQGFYGGTSPTFVRWGPNQCDYPSASVRRDDYGGTATALLVNSSAHNAFYWFRASNGPNGGTFNLSTGGQGGGTGIGGYNDWYMPTRDEAKMCFRAFKHNSGTVNNYTITYASPQTTNVTQNPNSLFQTGGSESFSHYNNWFLTAREAENNCSARGITMGNGNYTNPYYKSDTNWYLFAVRRVAVP